MELFKIDLMATSQAEEFRDVKTKNLEAEGFYGLLRIRMGERSYGFYFEEIANKLHHQDDLYYWIGALLEVATCISETEYCAICDIEKPDRWVEFINHRKLVEISVIDARGSSDLIVKKPFSEKKTVVEGVEVDRNQLIKEISDKANSFIARVMEIEPRFAQTSQHKKIVELATKANSISST